ncbi:SDR family oxidoreductase [Sediminibacterium ginsengisoli]|uniref:NAD(P)H dehydrogenase (Quinone) n=1 Tax=Sediminibacterium ginsengisoli TaxID=413434 RepID=A0A1T4P5S6_9BACT|nr:SDR family oxidoreductase [Sediminibacterium ginsengisoli]SJZ86761.1 NAD(P)H dehydrogenase (quinone) [Sediminibacterium ginsengisoli]
MILITGATGHFGNAVIDFLLKKIPAAEIAALVRDEQKAAGLKEKGIAIRTGNYFDKTSLVKAFTGIDKLLLVSSNDFNDRFGQHRNVIDAAVEAGVKYVAYTGVSLKDVNTSVLKDAMQSHTDTDEYLRNSGLTYTLLNNSLYADIIPMFTGVNIAQTGIAVPAGNGKVPFATRSDMAEAAANVLTQPGHENKQYPIGNGIAYSFADIAATCATITGKPVNYTDLSHEAFLENLKNAGVPDGLAAFTAGFALAIKNDEFNLPDDTLEKLLGRKPQSLEAYLRSRLFNEHNTGV